MHMDIHPSKMKKLEKKVAAMNRRGVKIGGGKLEIANVHEWAYKKELGHGRYVMVPQISLDIIGEVPRVAGYTVLARVEHTDAGNILTHIEGDESELDDWRHAPSTCEHCNTKRRRRDTFFVRHDETGNVKRVGRSCLADYVRDEGIAEVAKFFLAASWFNTLGGYEDPTNYYPELNDYLACACAAVRQDNGFFPSREEHRSTKVHASWIYWPPPSTVPSIEKEKWQRAQPSVEDKAKAKQIVAWVAQLDASTNTYLHNLQTACALSYVTDRTGGLVVSAVQAFDRDRATRKTSVDNVESNYVGEIKQRLRDMHLVIMGVYWFATQFGENANVIMVDADGNVFKWRTGSCHDFGQGDSVVVTGTVVNHSVYRGVRQTVLSRCTMRAA